MKYITLILLLACGFATRAADKLFDDAMAANAVAVLRVDDALQLPIGDGKFDWYAVWPSLVIKNESSAYIMHTFQVAALKAHRGIPATSCTIYFFSRNLMAMRPITIIGCAPIFALEL